jgi:DNA-binding SARP family transcriptional activator
MLNISLLGSLRITYNDQQITQFASEKARALFCYLAGTGQTHGRDALAELLQEDNPETKAKNHLRIALADLRKLFPGYIAATQKTIRFAAENTYWLDIDEFKSQSLALGAGQLAIADLRAASDLYRGEFLDDFQPGQMPEFDEWLLAQRTYWNEKARQLFFKLAEQQIATQAYQEGAITLRRLLKVEPWHEPAHRQLMLALSHQGDFDGALAQYETCRQLIIAELGVQPEPETTALYERIRTARAGRPNNLPARSTPIIGREDEVSRVAEMLLNPDCRMVTIAGIGGMGKTSLALAVANHINQEPGLLFLDGITYVSLQSVEAATSDSDAIATAVAQTLDLHLPGRHPPSAEVVDYLEQEDQLLLFDNFEHLQKGASWLRVLLQRCPHIKLLVTSRELLNLAAEYRFALQGLPYPARRRRAQALRHPPEDYPAVQLFLQSARQARPNFALTEKNTPYIVELCQLVMGMPLALKLAASWLRVMPTEQLTKALKRNLDFLSTRMRDVPLRQRNMRAVFDSTWVMLQADEQRILAMLSLFRGGFSAAAAQELAAASTFDLAELQDRGLLQYEAEQGRYILHELVRQYASEKLVGPGDQLLAARDAHSHYYAQFLRKQISQLLSSELPQAIKDLDAEIGNIRAGWRWAIRTEHDQVLPDLGYYARALRFYYTRRSLYHEGLEMCRLFIKRIEAQGTIEPTTEVTALLGQMMLWEGVFSYGLGEIRTVADRFRSSLNLLAKQDPDAPFAIKDMAGAYHMSGYVELDSGNYLAAKNAFREAQRLENSLGNVGFAAKSAAFIGILALDMGEYEEAEAELEATIPVLRNNHDYYYSAIALGGLAQVRDLLDKPSGDIEGKLRRNLEDSRDLKSPLAEANSLLSLGVTLYLRGGEEVREAGVSLIESSHIFDHINAPIGLSRSYRWLATTHVARGQYPLAENKFKSCLRISDEHGLSPLMIDSLIGLVTIFTQSEGVSLSAEQAGAILTIAKEHPAANARARTLAEGLSSELERVTPTGPVPNLEQIVSEILN